MNISGILDRPIKSGDDSGVFGADALAMTEFAE
jgi:hypothetical protein